MSRRLGPRWRRTLGTFAVAVLASGCASQSSTDSTSDSSSAEMALAEQEAGASTSSSELVTTNQDLASMAGLTDESVLFGQSAALTGDAEDLGVNMSLGIRAAFAEVNSQGGVHGRLLELESLDDAYEPERAISNTQRLIEVDQVFALIGSVGTPTSRSALPVVKAANVPYVGAFTGASFLRDPDLTNVVNVRASYDQETEEMVARLIDELDIERIGIMYQDDSFGRAGYRGAKAALERRGMTAVSIGLYTRNTLAVKSGLLDVLRGSPEAIIIIGAYKPVAETIRLARTIAHADTEGDWEDPNAGEVTFLTLSFVGSNALASELSRDGAGVFVTQVVPFPTDTTEPIVASYLEALEVYDSEAEPSFVSLEGYIAGRLAITGLQHCGTDLDRDCFLKSFEALGDFDIDGLEFSYGAGDNQGSDKVYLTVIDENREYRPINSLMEAVSIMGAGS